MKKMLSLIALAGFALLASPHSGAQALPAAKIGVAAAESGVIQVRHRGHFHGRRHFGHRHHFHRHRHWRHRSHWRPLPYYGYRPHVRPLVCHRVWTHYGPRRVCHHRRWI